MNQPLYYPHGINIEDATKIKKAIHIPVTVVGSVTLEQAEEHIANGDIDMVSMARGLMADPYMVKNAKMACPEKTRPCIRCNNCINITHYKLAPVRCSVNAEMGMETIYMNVGTTTPKKIAVIGGGPAGMEFARTASQRGHCVDLFEKSDCLGGVLNMAAAPDFKADIKNYLEWSIRSVNMCDNVTVHLNTEAKPEDLSGYEVVVVAIGSEPIIPQFVKDNPNVVWVGDLEKGNATVGDDVVIVGAGLTGCECALSLSKQGKNVTLVDMIDEQSFGSGGAKFNQVALMGLLNDNHVKCIGNVKLVSNNNQLGFEHNGQSMDLAYDHVVLSLGVRPNPEVLSTFEDCANEVIYIGDCNTRIGTLYNAVHTAHEAASVL